MAAVTADVVPEMLDRVTGARGRPVPAVLELWWREVAVHLVDLDVGIDVTSWDVELRDHLAGYLAARVPRGMALELIATDADEHRVLGDGPDLVLLRGTANALIAWLAGRPIGGVVAERGGRPVDPPTLEPWP
jgi:maleylpyruvate isomerase